MKDNKYTLNIVLAIVLGIALLAAMATKTFLPWLCMPAVTIPLVAGMGILALLVESYLVPKPERCWICIPVLSAATFGVLPAAAGYVAWTEAAMLALVGGVTFTVLTWMFSFANERIHSGGIGKLAPIMTAACLFLATQCFTGMLL